MRSEVNSAAYRYPYVLIRGIIENKERYYFMDCQCVSKNWRISCRPKIQI